MNNLNDEQMDRIIKEKFQKDNKISNKANLIFENFNPQTEEKSNIKEKMNTDNQAVLNNLFYKKLNKILSIAAVSLSVLVVGGTTLYFCKNGKINFKNPDNVITYNQNYLVKNNKLKISNEQIIKEIDDEFIKVYLVGKRDVGINLTSTYWDEFEGEFKSTECYKIDNIDKDVKDIFIGYIGGYGFPFVFLLMEDNTVEYVDIQCLKNYAFYYEAQKLEGLEDVVGFEQRTRKFSYSNTDYQYVNAIRSDGLRKEIEIGVLNNWEDTVSENYNKLNEKYIKVHNGETIPNDLRSDFEVDGATYIHVNGEDKYWYCYKGDYMNHDLYRIEVSTGKEECLASGLNGLVSSDSEGKICVYVVENLYTIYELDKNVVFRNDDNSVINKITTNSNISENNTNESNLQQLSEFEKKVFESGDYYRNSLTGHYWMKTSKDSNSAYLIEDNKLFRTNIKDNDSISCIATGIDDLYKDENGNLIAVAKPDFTIQEKNDKNITYKEYTITDSPVVDTFSNENIEITLKKDGSLTTKILSGGLQRLGFNPGETQINENVLYNTFGSAHGVENKNTHLYYANAKKGILAKAGRNGRLCFAYEKGDGNVIAIDILNAIECGSFTGAKTSQCYIEGKIEKLIISEFENDKDKKGNVVPKYKTIFVLEKDKNGKSISRHIYMPCEDM